MTSRAGSSPVADSDDEDDDEDELQRYLRTHRRIGVLACPNPIKWWLDREAEYPNLSRMALDYLIIPSTYTRVPIKLLQLIIPSNSGTSVDAERAFSQCTLMLGKLRTRLSDETFRAGLLLRSWHLAGLLPELGELVQSLRDVDGEKKKNESAAKSAASAREKRKRADTVTATGGTSGDAGPSSKRPMVDAQDSSN